MLDIQTLYPFYVDAGGFCCCFLMNLFINLVDFFGINHMAFQKVTIIVVNNKNIITHNLYILHNEQDQKELCRQ